MTFSASFDPSKIRGLILDMDGVLWRNTTPIGDLAAIFKDIDKIGMQVIMATNNATRSPDQYVKKLAGFGVTIQPWQVINSAMATVRYLNNRFPDGGRVFVLGESALVQMLMENGFTHNKINPLAVVVALDRGLNYEKLKDATLLIRNGIPFIGTNPDKTFPIPEGQVPGTGSILAALEAASGISPQIMGKPQPDMYYAALERLGTSPEETLAVGDRLETDIAGAQNAKCLSALVLSGVTTLEIAQQWQPAPDIITKDLASLVEQLKQY